MPVLHQNAKYTGSRSWRSGVKQRTERAHIKLESIIDWICKEILERCAVVECNVIWTRSKKVRWESVSGANKLWRRSPTVFFSPLPVQRWIFSFIFGTKDKFLIRLKTQRTHSLVTRFKVLPSSNNSWPWYLMFVILPVKEGTYYACDQNAAKLHPWWSKINKFGLLKESFSFFFNKSALNQHDVQLEHSFW